MLGYGNGVILGYNVGELLDSTPGYADRSIIGLDEGTELGSPDGSFDGSN